MPDITTKTFAQLISGYAAAVQAAAAGLVDFTIGSILRANAEAVGQVGLWLQALILRVLAMTRASTSQGADLDSWMADFGAERLEADGATGELRFTRPTGTGTATIPVGASAETVDGSQLYLVAADPDHAAWNGSNGYLMGNGVTALTVPAAAVSEGSSGNVAPNSVTVLTTAIAGIGGVNNPTAFANGSDDESDKDFRARFPLYLASLMGATEEAVVGGVMSLEAGARAVVKSGELYNGDPMGGNFVVVVDDGSGAPDAAFLSAAIAKVEQYRPLGSTFQVFAPVVVDVDVVLVIEVDPDYVETQVVEAVEAAVTAYFATLTMDSDLVANRVAREAYNASDGVLNVLTATINGGTANIDATYRQRLMLDDLTVTAA